MSRLTDVVLFSILVVSSLTTVHAQENPSVGNLGDLKTVIVATEAKSNSVIAVPPVTSWSMSLLGE